MIIKKYFPIFAAALISVSCGEDIERSAQALIDEARAAYEVQDYAGAKLLLDSMKSTYPKAFKARRQALQLSRDVELGEQERSLSYYTKQLEQLEQTRDNMLAAFVLDKDSRYQDIGYYMLPEQTIKNNVGNSYLRAQVSEKGVAMITSIYRGKAISHTTLRVSCGDSYAVCEAPKSKYSSKHLGVTTERISYVHGEDGGIMDFVANGDGPFTVELSGKGKFNYTLRKSDAEAVKSVLELTRVIQAVESMRELRDEAARHIEFVKRSKEKYDVNPQAEE